MVYSRSTVAKKLLFMESSELLNKAVINLPRSSGLFINWPGSERIQFMADNSKPD